MGDLPDMRMIDDDEIELPRQLFDGECLEILQRPLFPFDLDTRVLKPAAWNRRPSDRSRADGSRSCL